MSVKEQSDGKEQRISPRMKYRAAVQYQSPASMSSGSSAMDLSETGIRIRSSEFLIPKSRLMVQVSLGSGKIVDRWAEVIWTRLLPHSDWYESGLEFENDEAPILKHKPIHDYINGFNADSI